MAGQLPRRGFNYFSKLKDSGITEKVFIFLELRQSQQVSKAILGLV